MKYAFVTCLFMIVGLISLKAQKCKWDVNEVDQFTGAKHLVCKKELINQDNHKAGQPQSYSTVILELKNGKVLFNAKHRIGGPVLGVDKIVGPTLVLRTSNAETITIKSSESFVCQLFIGATEVDFQFELSKDQLSILKSGLEAFRFSFNGKDYDFTLSNKEKDKLTSQFVCLLAEI